MGRDLTPWPCQSAKDIPFLQALAQLDIGLDMGKDIEPWQTKPLIRQ